MRALVALLVVLLVTPSAGAAPAPETVRVPLPGLGDLGRYEVNGSGGSRDNASFAWKAERFPDAWGILRDGAALETDAWGGGCSFRVSTSQTAATAQTLPAFGWFAEGEAPVATARPTDSMCGIFVGTGSSVVGGRGVMRITYGAAPDVACLFRGAAQGATLAVGDEVAFCPTWNATWRVAQIAPWRGFHAARLEATTPHGAASAWLAEGVPYPLDVVVPGKDGSASYHLAALTIAGPAIPRPRVDGAPALTPVDPLLGPAEGDATLPLPLSVAARSATTDPTLLDLQALLAKPGAALATGVMRASGPSAAWTLLFAAPGVSPVGVVCQGAASVARCRPAAEGTGLDAPPAGFGAQAVPRAGASFAQALARWRAMDPNATAPVDASYRSWASATAPASILVGDLASDPAAGAPGPAGREPSTVTLALADARTTEAIRTATAPFAVSGFPAGLQPPGTTPADARAEPSPLRDALGSPIVVGAGALAALVVLALLLKSSLVGLYARLTGRAVLESAARQRILARVAADPGIHAAPLLAELGRGNGLGEHHLAVLVREGHLACVATPGFRRYFVAGSLEPRAMRRAAFLRDGPCARVYEAARAHPDISLSDAAREAGLSLPYASRTAKRLAQAGLLERRREGGGVRLRVAEG
ncbi:MAG: hypothetical protein QOE90_1075 [Thermoplasmata archaeon]|jgi:DNA-binding transcriptional ArsR family regulator|nr:hypothetical protein [Thermoplasmata archaeon]